MTDEIIKLYENAGIKPLCQIPDGYCGIKNVYEDFTAEKQIFLLQWLLNRADLYLHKHKSDFTYSIASSNYAVNKYRDFKKSIAEFVNKLWQSLSEEEKQQIKEILNG